MSEERWDPGLWENPTYEILAEIVYYIPEGEESWIALNKPKLMAEPKA